ncbi:sortase [Streptomyces sp. DSM 42041]|uniref:Sortase n=1 Tax=Streptomyces hazeniae TaxID=3075538 RepID=A0ABU2P1D7_9ACTN|nr:sortase [Streptomyces sp. DSM 42041]MDT0381723.1 sortase [Streptomyces sp. DSM 42041]
MPSSATERRGDPGREAMARSEPSRITGRSVGLSAAVTPVGLADDGSIALPGDADRAGWYDGSVTPGEAGNAVLVAHVDSTSGPAAFYELGALEEGDRVTVRRRDGSTARFTVTGIAVHPRDEMPAAVYRPTLRPRLTLITCTEWDPEARAYRSNLVVTSLLTGGRG